MRKVDYDAILNGLMALSWRYVTINSGEFSDECKKFKITLGNGMKEAYQSVGIIGCPQRGTVVLVKENITRAKVIEAYNIVRRERKKRKDLLEGTHAFNIAVAARNNPDFTPEACAKYLTGRGYFVYKPKKGEKIFIGKEFN